MRRRFGGFRPPSRPPVKVTTGIQVKRTRCKGCQQFINPGDPYARLQLQKMFRNPCSSCSMVPKGAKRYHAACQPADINKAMGYDAAKHAAPRPVGTPIPPPPKPPTFEEAALTALASLEAALILKARKTGITEEMQSKFKTFQGIKARVLRPGTESEGEAATYVAIQTIVKLVFA